MVIRCGDYASRHWHLWGEFTGDRWIPLTEASDAENVSIWWRHDRTQGAEHDHLLLTKVFRNIPVSVPEIRP